ncbi:ribonuclease HII [Arenibaculum sp.]|jgi:ribonuclease HII|uniref:ribonuclease HII n=1 Tax=Arenibaculum sp. TaxID=2865862 RepID=UPI002E0D4DDE|nr:ribonuclease HII [Arenibaculum sp.]
MDRNGPPDFSLELEAGHAGGRLVCGVDEVGRGPLAGPVVAAAAILPDRGLPPGVLDAIDDSKAIPRSLREELAPLLLEHGWIALGVASVEEIDRINILQASLLAMGRAVEALGVAADLALVDGRHAPRLACPARAVVGGDARCLSIAAASIVAKVERDRIMAELAIRHPGYGWERNAGYPTPEHRAALARLGPTPHHRRSFAPVSQLLALSV